MEIIYKKVNDLIPYINNSRTHSEEQVNQIVASINEFGFTNPLLIDEKDNIIAGHGRLLASKKLKMEEVPCIVLSGLTEAQKKAYIIADNKMALNAGWDEELLKIELENLKELDFDLELTGFNVDELDDIFQADVSVNIYAFLKAQETGKVVELCCAIGDDTIDDKPYAEIVEEAREYINSLGGFEKFAEWGLY